MSEKNMIIATDGGIKQWHSGCHRRKQKGWLVVISMSLFLREIWERMV